MAEYLQKLSNNASIAACVAAIISAAVAAWAAHTSFVSAERIANLQNRQQILGNLNNSSGQFIADGGKFIFDVNNSKPLKASKEALSTLVAQQMQQAELVKLPLRLTDDDVRYYEDALSDFEHKTNAVNSAVDMPEWGQSFGHLLDVQRVLSQRLAKENT